MRKIRCPICEERSYFKDRPSLIGHIEKSHKSSIPAEWDASRYENFLRTGKEFGLCMVCKGKTGWNETTKKYHRICKRPQCRKVLADKAEQNMVKKTGMTKSERMKQPSVQISMIYSKHTSGCYKVGTHEIWYDSSYVKDFLEMVNTFLHLDMSDISGPSTNTYSYIYNGETHMYIPDLIIHSLGLEIEIKDGGDNPNNHPKIQMVDKKKEEQKDKVMDKLQKEGKIRYIKISNKNYEEFFKLLMDLRDKYDGVGKSIQSESPVSEGLTIVNESLDIRDIPATLKIHKAASGKTASYRSIINIFLEKIKTMTSKDAAFWETRARYTLELLTEKKASGDKSYELEETINDMKTIVIPQLERKMDKLKTRKKV